MRHSNHSNSDTPLRALVGYRLKTRSHVSIIERYASGRYRGYWIRGLDGNGDPNGATEFLMAIRLHMYIKEGYVELLTPTGVPVVVYR